MSASSQCFCASCAAERKVLDLALSYARIANDVGGWDIARTPEEQCRLDSLESQLLAAARGLPR